MDILDQINRATEDLMDGCRWSSGALFAEVGPASELLARKDFLYEIDCLMRIIEDLQHHHEIEFVEGEGYNRFCFPKSPANKAQWPRFMVRDRVSGTPLMQVCVGTKIWTMINDRYRAPDISFQVADASLAPTKLEVILIYDCKYNEGSKHKTGLSLTQFSYFSQMVRDLDLVHVLDNLPFAYQSLKGLEANAILTNGEGYSNDHAYHALNFFKVVFHFDGERVFRIVG